jgi:hypothetical protein
MFVMFLIYLYSIILYFVIIIEIKNKIVILRQIKNEIICYFFNKKEETDKKDE